MTKKKRSLRNEKLKANRASETEEQRKERLRIRRENEKIENQEQQRLATLKRLKRGEVEEKPKGASPNYFGKSNVIVTFRGGGYCA